MADEKITDETYKIGVVCSNCEYHGLAHILKGTLVSQTQCPRCGNKTLRPALPGEA
jgi:predicted nucleic-acid-binding Zn-ribbon protein